MQKTLKDKIKEYIETELTDKRKKHTYAVAKEAVKLARRFGADTERAEIAALFHDMFRGKPAEILDNYILKFNIDRTYLGNANLSHSKIAAAVMKSDYGIEDRDIINAVAYHTTGRAGMSELEKIIFLADAIEPGRKYPGVEYLRILSYENLDKACLLSLNRTIEYIIGKGLDLDIDTLKARDYLLEKERREHE